MKISWKGVVRDVILIYCLTFAGGLAVGYTVRPGPTRLKVLIITSLFLEVVGFTISGCIVKVSRFKHLFIVAVALWIVNLSNVALGLSTFLQWLISLVSIHLMMLIGGGISFLFVRVPMPVQVQDPSTDRP